MIIINFADRSKLIMATVRALLYSDSRVILMCSKVKTQEDTLKALSSISCDNQIQTEKKENVITFKNGSTITCLVSGSTNSNVRGNRAKLALPDWSDCLIDEKMLEEVLSPFQIKLKWWQRLKIWFWSRLPSHGVHVWKSSRWR